MDLSKIAERAGKLKDVGGIKGEDVQSIIQSGDLTAMKRLRDMAAEQAGLIRGGKFPVQNISQTIEAFNNVAATVDKAIRSAERQAKEVAKAMGAAAEGAKTGAVQTAAWAQGSPEFARARMERSSLRTR